MESKFHKKRIIPAYYSDEFKQAVIQEHLTTGISRTALQRKYGIKGHSAIKSWMESLSYVANAENNAILEPNQVELAKKDTSLDSATTKAMAAEIKRLKQQLEDERLRSEMLNRMVDLAEKTYKISVRKNSNTK